MSRIARTGPIVVIGAGSTACALLPMLAAMPGTHIAIVDGDTVSADNLERQTLYGPPDVGRMKVDVAAQRLASIMGDRTISVHPCFLDAGNAATLLQGAALVCDCTDDLPARRLIQRTCAALGIPLVSGAVHREQVQVVSWPGGHAQAEVFSGIPAEEQEGCLMQDVPVHATAATAALMAMHVGALLVGDERLCGKVELLDMRTGRWLRIGTSTTTEDHPALAHDRL